MSATITGTLTCHRLAIPRRRTQRNIFSSLVADLIDPLPPHLLWVIVVPDDSQPARPPDGTRTFIYRTRSGKLPACLDAAQEGQTVTIRAKVEPWSNGLGAFMSNVRVLAEASR